MVISTSVTSVLKNSYAILLHYTISQLKVVLERHLHMDTECIVFKRRRLTPGEWSVLAGDQTVEDLITEGSLWPGSEVLMSPNASY